MKILKKEVDEPLIVEKLLETPGIDVSRALATVRLIPSLLGDRARHALRELLSSESVAIRNKAAELIVLHDDPHLGARHILYNAMWRHPMLDTINAHSPSGWTSAYLLRFSHLITREMCELLFAEQELVQSPIHAEGLAAAEQAISIEDLRRSCEGQSAVQQATVAFVAAYRGIKVDPGVVERMAERFSLFGLVACALACRRRGHISDEILTSLENFKGKYFSGYGLSDGEAATYLTIARGAEPIALFRRFFGSEPPSFGKNGKWQDSPAMFRWRSPKCAILGPDYLWSFTSAADREILLKEQKAAVCRLLEIDDEEWLMNAVSRGDSLRWEIMPPGRTSTEFLLPGVSIEFEKADVMAAAVDWVGNPKPYRIGLLDSVRRSQRM